MKSNNHLVGVGGWLAFLVILLTIIGPLFGVGRLLNEILTLEQDMPQLLQSGLWSSYKLSSWAIFLLSSLISISAGIALKNRHHPSTVAYTVACLWVLGPVANIAQLTTAVIIFGEKLTAEVLPETLGGITASILVTAIWTAYLLLSKRVKNTYYGSANLQLS